MITVAVLIGNKFNIGINSSNAPTKNVGSLMPLMVNHTVKIIVLKRFVIVFVISPTNTSPRRNSIISIVKDTMTIKIASTSDTFFSCVSSGMLFF